LSEEAVDSGQKIAKLPARMLRILLMTVAAQQQQARMLQLLVRQ